MTSTKPEPSYEAKFARSTRKLKVLSVDQAREFVENGYVVVKSAFSQTIADQICNYAWDELKESHGISKDDRSTWRSHPHGYIRTNGQKLHINLAENAKRALSVQADVAGGINRLPQDGKHLALTGGVITNFGVEDHGEWRPPGRHQGGWHKDGWHFRHFLDSPEQGLLTVPIYTQVLKESGGTFLARDSIAPVARLLAKYPTGFHADSVQGAGYLIPYLIDQCSDFVELTGEPGDLAILHPFILHRRSINPTDRPRFIANLAIVLKEPMDFYRGPNDHYSLVELAVLRALSKSSLGYAPANPREAFVPLPFRNEEETKLRHKQLTIEMQQMASEGILTPEWGRRFGYMSNAPGD